MSDQDDRLAARYRELAREEPSPAVDAAILAAGRRAARPRTAARWAGPVSIAAVLVLGIGVTLRMQLEQPGIETSQPTLPPSQSEYSMPESAAPEVAARPELKDAAPPAPTEKLRKQAPPPQARPTAPPTSTPLPAPAPAFVPEPAPARPPAAASAPAPAAVAPSQSPAAPPPVAPPRRTEGAQGFAASPPPAPQGAAPLSAAQAPMAAPRAKREAAAADSAVARESARPVDEIERELERIARLRAAGRHEEADKALAEFRRRHPGYRIPDAMWERLKPR